MQRSRHRYSAAKTNQSAHSEQHHGEISIRDRSRGATSLCKPWNLPPQRVLHLLHSYLSAKRKRHNFSVKRQAVMKEHTFLQRLAKGGSLSQTPCGTCPAFSIKRYKRRTKDRTKLVRALLTLFTQGSYFPSTLLSLHPCVLLVHPAAWNS